MPDGTKGSRDRIVEVDWEMGMGDRVSSRCLRVMARRLGDLVMCMGLSAGLEGSQNHSLALGAVEVASLFDD